MFGEEAHRSQTECYGMATAALDQHSKLNRKRLPTEAALTGCPFLSSASWCAEACGTTSRVNFARFTLALQLHWISRPLQPGGAPKFVKTNPLNVFLIARPPLTWSILS
jgi:hypothetical protein